MNNKSKKVSERSKVLKMIRTSAVIRNPLLLEAIGLCPVVAIATTLKSSLFIALVTAVELIICEVLASKFLKNVTRFLRVAIYFIVGTIVVCPIMALVTKYFPVISLEFGVFLPLLAVNSLLALHCERVAVKRTVKDSFLDSLSVSVSYGVVTVFAGIVREILGKGTIGEKELNLPVTFPIMLLPFGGLLVLGFTAAVLKFYIYKKYPQSSPDRAFNTSEVRVSLKGSLRELMNDDFNPYDEGEDGIGSGDGDTARKIILPHKIDMPKKEKTVRLKKDKPKKEKKTKNASGKRHEKVNEHLTENKETVSTRERTYLDDFSDMLSDLETYKSKTSEHNDESEGDQ